MGGKTASGETVFSSIDIAYECLKDKKRIEKFENAIARTVKKGDVVLEIGTGTAVLSLFAAKCGAKKVYAVELDEVSAYYAEKIVKENGYGQTIEIICADATEMEPLHDSIDVVLMELLTTGMIDEMQVPVYNNLVKWESITKNTILIPQKVVTKAELLRADFEIYGFKFTMPLHEWFYQEQQKKEVMSKKVFIDLVNFQDALNEQKEIDLRVKKEIEFKITKNGKANALLLSSYAVLAEKSETGNRIQIGESTKIFAPVVMPLHQEKNVKEGATVKIKFDYKRGGSYMNFKTELVNV